jgi:hypothetical protein
MKSWIVLIFTMLLLTACATYYQNQQDFMQAIYNDNYALADKILGEKKVRNKDELLYFLNRGSLHWMMNDPLVSNQYFQQADYYVEDYRTNYAAKAASYLYNPTIIPYGGESFEQLMIHYYTALNYAYIGDYEKALIETKRMLLKHQKINDFNKGHNKYNKDAFVNVLLGIVYEATHDYNNAFIAFRNAYSIYEEDYKSMFKIHTPNQLKQDMIRTAHLSGFIDEREHYEQIFNIQFKADKDSTQPIYFFWNNGLGPVKDEISINFTVVGGAGGTYYLVNNEYSLRIPYTVNSDDDSKNMNTLKIVRIAFPKYVSRNTVYKSAQVVLEDSTTYQLDLCQPIDAIAYRSLQDRFLLEITNAVVRMTAKRLAQLAAASKSEGAGIALEIINAATEKADTRNWQLLPHDIYYTRILVPDSSNKVYLNLSNQLGIQSKQVFIFDKNKKGIKMMHYQSPQFLGYNSN